MKKKYFSPVIEVVTSQLKGQLMKHSNDWADAKGANPDEQNNDDEMIKNKNLWED